MWTLPRGKITEIFPLDRRSLHISATVPSQITISNETNLDFAIQRSTSAYQAFPSCFRRTDQVFLLLDICGQLSLHDIMISIQHFTEPLNNHSSSFPFLKDLASDFHLNTFKILFSPPSPFLPCQEECTQKA